MCGSFWTNGEIQSCRAAQDFGVPFALSTNALLSIDDVAEGVDKPFWFQLYLEKDRGFSEHLIDRAKALCCPVLILTMDLHVEGIRYVDAHNGLGAPPKLSPQITMPTPASTGFEGDNAKPAAVAANAARQASTRRRSQRSISIPTSQLPTTALKPKISSTCCKWGSKPSHASMGET